MISRAFAGLPPSARGQRVGLLGGSFNPPHEGHRAASLLALRRLRLDRIWWVVTQGNPLKDTRELPPVVDRLEAARRIASHPAIDVTGFEERLGSPYTCDLVAELIARRPGVRFVFILGADAFASFHRWRHWRRIAKAIPLAVIDRPGFTLRAMQTRAAAAFGGLRLDETDATILASAPPPSYVFLHGPRSDVSSTLLREKRAANSTTSLLP